jgi:hypothetical protein
VTLLEADIDQIIEKIAAKRAENNVWFCQAWAMMFKCPHCGPKAKSLQAKIRAVDVKITELNELLCA